MSRVLLTALSLAGLIMAGMGTWLMFPQIERIGEEAGVSGIPYIALIFAGLVAGAFLAVLRNYVGKALNRYLLNMAIGFALWGIIGGAAGLFTGDGPVVQRVLEGRIIGLWFSALFIVISILPGIMGSFGALTGSKAAMSSTVAVMMAMSIISMVYSEARFNLLLDQGIPESVMTISGLVLFVEGLSMIRREEEFKGGHMGRTILRRNLAFLGVFMVVSSVVAMIPFMIEPGFFRIYEASTIYGKAVIGLALLVPLALLAIARRRS